MEKQWYVSKRYTVYRLLLTFIVLAIFGTNTAISMHSLKLFLLFLYLIR